MPQSIKTLLCKFVSLVVLISIAGTAWKLYHQYDLAGLLLSASFGLAVVLAVAYRLVNPAGWVFVLRGLGHDVPIVSATEIWLHAESRRWLPGGVWGYASRANQAREVGVPLATASASMLIELLLTMVAAIAVGVVGVAMFGSQLAAAVQATIDRSGIQHSHLMFASVGLTFVSLVVYCLRFKVQKKFQAFVAKWSALHTIRLNPAALAIALFYLIAMACLNGIINTSLVRVVALDTHVPVMAMIAATAIAWVVGLLAFFSPGGILVREATLAAILIAWLPYEQGFLLAMLSRFAQLIAEVVGMFLVKCIQTTTVSQEGRIINCGSGSC